MAKRTFHAGLEPFMPEEAHQSCGSVDKMWVDSARILRKRVPEVE
jgi:hypothetical protein